MKQLEKPSEEVIITEVFRGGRESKINPLAYFRYEICDVIIIPQFVYIEKEISCIDVFSFNGSICTSNILFSPGKKIF